MSFYSAYGLEIYSEITFPEMSSIQPLKAEPDVIIRKVDLAHADNAEPLSTHHTFPSEQEAHFQWETLGRFKVLHGREIIVETLPGLDESMVRLPLYGTIFAILLHQRGFLVLHGSSVALGQKAAIFLGDKGQGKSTLAASLYARGHLLLTDDVVALQTDDTGNLWVIPGFPHFKLWPDSVTSALGDDPYQLPELAPGYDKRARRATDNFAQEPFQLQRVYVLATETPRSIVTMTPQEAIAQIINHSYTARFGSDLLQGPAASTHFLRCGHLIQQTPPRWLKRERSLEALSDVAQMVEEDIALVTQTAHNENAG